MTQEETTPAAGGGGPVQKPRKGGVAADATFLETLDQTSSVLDLHRSNLLRLQAEELVQECKNVSHSTMGPFVDQLSSLVNSVSISKIDQTTLDTCPFPLHTDKSKLLEGLTKKKHGALKAAPFLPLNESATVFSILGKHSCGITKPSGNAKVLPTFDLVVHMPKDLWDTKDYKNHRYFDKRNLVLWHLAQSLSNKKHRSKVGQVLWNYERNDTRKPTLMVIPPSSNNSNNPKKRKRSTEKVKPPKFRVRIRLEMESIDWIPPLRLVPNRCNPTTGSGGSPIYNHALLEDAYSTFLPSNHPPKRSSNDSDSDDDDDDEEHYPHMMDALILAKIWCLQRGLLRAHDGFDTDQLALLMLYLYRTKQANPRMAPLQVLAVLFKCLAETAWLEEDQVAASDDNEDENNLLRRSPSVAAATSTGKRRKRVVLVLPTPGKNEGQTIAHSSLAKLYAQQTKESPLTDKDPPTLVELYRRQFPGPVFLDSSLRYNYFGRLAPSFIQLVQYEAKRSLRFLNSPTGEAKAQKIAPDKPFHALFMTPARFWDRFDLYVKIPLDSIRKEPSTSTVADSWSKASQEDCGYLEALTRSMMEVLQIGLGDRIRSMRFLSTGNATVSDSYSISSDDLALDSDQIPRVQAQKARDTASKSEAKWSPTGDDCIILGVSLNADTCPRIVDRGPPAEQSEAVKAFVEFWGDKAELRRFKDGAIVQAVVWNSTKNEPGMDNSKYYIRYQNEDALQGGVAERIIHYTLSRHFLKSKKRVIPSPLRDMTSLVDGAAIAADDSDRNAPWFSDPIHAHRSIMKAFDELATFLKDNSLATIPVPGTLEEKTSNLGIPLTIDAVEPLSPSLRYSELFPAIPHPFLGSDSIKGTKKIPGVVASEPILMQIRFGASSKWPTEIKAIGAAKTAMLIQLANGLENMQSTHRHDCGGFSKLVTVTPSFLDVGYRGYVFRIQVRADPEIKLLQGLFKPSEDAATLLRQLTKDHIISAMHHSMIHAIHTKHPSASGVVRMAMRWISGHMLSGLIPLEAVELLVAKIYSDTCCPLDAPGSVVVGFLRFLSLLECHDWIRDPLIVDPHGHLDEDDRRAIKSCFEQARGPNQKSGPPMYIVSPTDRAGLDDSTNPVPAGMKATMKWTPSFTEDVPEWVVLTRAIALAKKTRGFLQSKLYSFEGQGDWSAAFQETSSSYGAYNALLRVNSDLVTDAASSSTGNDLSPSLGSADESDLGPVVSVFSRSMRERYFGPKRLCLKIYRNMYDEETQHVSPDWRPVDMLVLMLRKRFGSAALFFYNALCPDVIGILWRPKAISSQPFSVVGSEYAQPCIEGNWKADTMVTLNARDALREMSQFWSGVVVKTKLLVRSPKDT